MLRLMLVTFVFLAWGFYELSGGADFDPDQARLDTRMPAPLKQAAAEAGPPAADRAEDVAVTRVSLNLNSVEDVLNGPDNSAETARLPGRRTEPAVLDAQQPDDIEIIPSLIENAAAEPQPDEIPPSSVNSATVEDDTSVIRSGIDAQADLRVVTGTRVNVRGGPGTNYGVIGTLVQGDRVEVLDDSGSGWLRLRAADGGTMGWMAASLLSDG